MLVISMDEAKPYVVAKLKYDEQLNDRIVQLVRPTLPQAALPLILRDEDCGGSALRDRVRQWLIERISYRICNEVPISIYLYVDIASFTESIREEREFVRGEDFTAREWDEFYAHLERAYLDYIEIVGLNSGLDPYYDYRRWIGIVKPLSLLTRVKTERDYVTRLVYTPKQYRARVYKIAQRFFDVERLTLLLTPDEDPARFIGDPMLAEMVQEMPKLDATKVADMSRKVIDDWLTLETERIFNP